LTLGHGYFLVSIQKQRALLREAGCEKKFKQAEKIQHHWKEVNIHDCSRQWDRLNADGYN